MQIQKIIGKVMQVLPKTEGAAGKIHLGEKQIGEFLKRGGSRQEAKALKELVGGLKSPSIDIAYKAKSNYTIAGLQLNEGKEVVGRTAVSVVNAGGKNSVVKARVSLGKGSETLYANGFIDAGQTANSRDMAASLSRKGGKVKADATISKAAGTHVQLDEDKVIGLVKKLPNGDDIVSKYNKGQWSLQQGLDQAMRTAREWLSGGGAIPKSSKTATKVAGKLSKPANKVAEKIKPFPKPVAQVADKAKSKLKGVKILGHELYVVEDKALSKSVDQVADKIKPKAFKINEFGEAEYIKATKALKGKSATKARTAAERFKEAFGVTRRTYMNRLKKAKAAGDEVTFEKLRAEMGQKGYQPYFDRHTGALKIMEGASNFQELTKKLGLS